MLKGSKGTGSKLKGVVLEFGRGVMEVVDFSRLESEISLIFGICRNIPFFLRLG